MARNMKFKNIKIHDMKNLYRTTIALAFALILMLPKHSIAGNKDRSGQAGASELLINPWASTTGWGNAGSATVMGLEAIFGNVGGLSRMHGLDVGLSYANYLREADINLFSFGLATKVGESGAMGFYIANMSFGELQKTTVSLPEGGAGTFSPSCLNINLAYGHSFSSSIHGGFVIKMIAEQSADVAAQGVAIDAGIQYIAGSNDQIKFGVALKNIGTPMMYRGDGLSFKYFIPGVSGTSTYTAEWRSDKFELPAQLNIGVAYDWTFVEKNRFTLAGTFVSNSFSRDQLVLGGEFSLSDIVLLRTAYTYEADVMDADKTLTLHKGLSAGCSVQMPLNKEEKTNIGIDFSYQATRNFSGIYRLGVHLTL